MLLAVLLLLAGRTVAALATSVQLGQACAVRRTLFVPCTPLVQRAPSPLAAQSAEPLQVKEERTARKRLHVRIHDVWYDLTAWRVAHPAGTHWIDGFADSDATEVFFAFHSDDAAITLARLPVAVAPPTDAPPVSPIMRSFRELRAQLVEEGWWKRSWRGEATVLAPCILLYLAGTLLARRRALLATVLLSLGSTASGWLAHDYIHGRGRWCSLMRSFGALFNGHSATWWSNKHNLHHARTNEVGVDEDIMSDPFFYFWPPDPKHDSRLRPLQYLYFPALYSILFALWRVNSLRTVKATPRLWRSEGLPIALNYAWMLFLLPAGVAVGHVFLAGLISALIVTVTHQAEDMFTERNHDWVDAQLRSTRNAATSNPFSEWLWGGMQYQLEHHLFPTMPRYKYAALAPIVRRWATEAGAEYREDGEWRILCRNIAMLRDVAHAPAAPGAPMTRADTVWSRREAAAWVGATQ